MDDNENGNYTVEYELSTGRIVTIKHNPYGTGVVIDWAGSAGGGIPVSLQGSYTSFGKARDALELYVHTKFKKDIVSQIVKERSTSKDRRRVSLK